MAALDAHVMGERFEFLVAQTPAADLSAVPITLVLDPPLVNGATVAARIVLRYLNGGSDGVLEPGGLAVRFVKLPPWSALNLSPGLWDFRLSVGAAGTTQDHVGLATLKVVQPRNGALPTAGV